MTCNGQTLCECEPQITHPMSPIQLIQNSIDYARFQRPGPSNEVHSKSLIHDVQLNLSIIRFNTQTQQPDISTNASPKSLIDDIQSNLFEIVIEHTSWITWPLKLSLNHSRSSIKHIQNSIKCAGFQQHNLSTNASLKSFIRHLRLNLSKINNARYFNIQTFLPISTLFRLSATIIWNENEILNLAQFQWPDIPANLGLKIIHPRCSIKFTQISLKCTWCQWPGLPNNESPK
jgi:hypothetical protein